MPFAIMVRSLGNDTGSEIEYCRVSSNPEAIAEELRAKRRRDTIVGPRGGLRKVWVPVYEHVEIKELP
jgi:hypothetical protein